MIVLATIGFIVVLLVVVAAICAVLDKIDGMID